MMQFFLLLLVSVAAATHEEVEEEEMAFGKRTIDPKNHINSLEVYKWLVDQHSCDEECPTNLCDRSYEEPLCGCGSRGDACSNNNHCCNYRCIDGKCGCGGEGSPCKLGRMNDCCDKFQCKNSTDALAYLDYGYCRQVRA